MIRRNNAALAGIVLLLATARAIADDPPVPAAKGPRSTDERLIVELFAEHPLIVTPTGITIDAAGRVFVAESHTHFRPDDYDGPEKDRILILEDTDADGRADRSTVFHEGFTWLMDIEFSNDGTLYAATRGDIFRLRDADSDNKADEVTTIVHLETTGTYPHNGLSGLAFDDLGNLHFGLGENLGHDYTLVGADGTRISGGKEGGSTYRVKADGTNLTRVSTGWWNPWGMCVDQYGRVFGTDNDPGESPPCRLIQVVEGADYGYEYRYGRSGLHPLVGWNGELPGTLPMIAGTGEAPCAIVAYDTFFGFPTGNLGHLLVASWADHRIEHYPIAQQRDKGLVTTRRQTLVEGEGDFRPVGLAVAPSGDVYFTDWVSSSYSLHKQGRVWRIRVNRKGRVLDEETQAELERQLTAAWLDTTGHGEAIDPSVVMQIWKARTDLGSTRDPLKWLADDPPPAVRAEAVKWLDPLEHRNTLLAALGDADPLVFHAAVQTLSRQGADKGDVFDAYEQEAPLGVLLAMKRHPETRARAAERKLGEWLAHRDPRVRFSAVKWVADDKLAQYRPQLEKLLDDESLDLPLFLATVAALDRLDGKEPSDRPSPERLLARIADERSSPAVRRLALRLIDPAHKPLTLAQLEPFVSHADAALRLEAVRTLAAHHDEARFALLERIARDEQQSIAVRAAAIAGLAPAASAHADSLLEMARGENRPLRDEALRSLIGVELTDRQRAALGEMEAVDIHSSEAIKRVLGRPLVERPAADDTVSWIATLPRRVDPQAGERIFFGHTLGACAKCHQVEGRGNAVGPSLTLISRRLDSLRASLPPQAKQDGAAAAAQAEAEKRWLLETILQPSREMAPQYTPWQIVTTDGRLLTGLPRRKGGNQEAYLGLDGKEFTIKKSDIEISRELDKSIMPDDVLRTLTPQEIGDLLAFLMQTPS